MEGKWYIQVNQLLASLSIALDLAQNRSYEHAKRTAYISLAIAKKMGLDLNIQENIYFAALLHDVGMAGELSKYSIDDFHKSARLKKMHVHKGAEIIEKLPFHSEIKSYVLYHHDYWDGSGVNQVQGNDIPLGAQIIHVADTLDILCNRKNCTYEDRVRLMNFIKQHKGTRFSPQVVEYLISLGETEKFWMDLQHNHMQIILNQIAPKKIITTEIEDLERIAEVFALLIDSKSRFTHTHSQEIAVIVKAMAKQMGYDEIKRRKIGIAGYMHDLGKLGIPNKILDKPGRLSDDEYMQMKSHPYYTKLIIGQVEGCEDIAKWAGNHHEKLNGQGYPERLNKEEIGEEDQIIAAADIYHALIEDRPYRTAMKKQDALQILNKMAQKQEISYKVLDCLEATIS